MSTTAEPPFDVTHNRQYNTRKAKYVVLCTIVLLVNRKAKFGCSVIMPATFRNINERILCDYIISIYVPICGVFVIYYIVLFVCSGF